MKSNEMMKFLDRVTAEAFGQSVSECVSDQICVICKRSATEFRDELSRVEYKISGMCQNCQDNTFVDCVDDPENFDD